MPSRRYGLRSAWLGGLALAAPLWGMGCLHSAVITTEPDEAEVWVQGQYLGTAPVTYRSRSGLPDSYTLRIEKEGYEPIKAMQIDKALRADASLLLLLAGIVPYFFSARLEDQYTFRLKPLPGPKSAAPAAPTAAPASSAPGAAPAPAQAPPASAPSAPAPAPGP